MSQFKKKKSNKFDCPMCGNPLVETTKPLIKCCYCNTIIVPKSKVLKREERIYEKKSQTSDNEEVKF